MGVLSNKFRKIELIFFQGSLREEKKDEDEVDYESEVDEILIDTMELLMAVPSDKKEEE